MKYYSTNRYFKDTFGCKVYKISLNPGFTCPNRDGHAGVGGCIFCSAGGSGDFAPDSILSIREQIEVAKKKVSKKIKNNDEAGYVAYFQAFTGTYGPIERLREIFYEAINRPEILGLSIATRPDCLPDDVISLIKELNDIKPVMVELGLQTIHEETAKYINRGYDLSCFDNAVNKLSTTGAHVIVHLIIGLPGETREMMLESVKYIAALGCACSSTQNNANSVKVHGIKLQLLHILKGTRLGDDYEKHAPHLALFPDFHVLTLSEYCDIICDALKIIPENMVVHRITGDGPKSILLAPIWSADKKKVLNTLNNRIQNI